MYLLCFIFVDTAFLFCGAAWYTSHMYIYVTCSGETGNKSEWQVSHKVGIKSAGYFYPIQSFLSRNCGTPFE